MLVLGFSWDLLTKSKILPDFYFNWDPRTSGFSSGHSVITASVCNPGQCSSVVRLPNEAWRPGCRLWEHGLWSDPGTVDKQEDKYNRWDLIPTPFILNSQERHDRRGTETWRSLTLMSLLPYLKVQITLTSYVNLEPQTSLEWSNPNHYFLVCIFWFPEREVCYFPSCHASLSHINTQEEWERENITA